MKSLVLWARILLPVQMNPRFHQAEAIRNDAVRFRIFPAQTLPDPVSIERGELGVHVAVECDEPTLLGAGHRLDLLFGESFSICEGAFQRAIKISLMATLKQ